MRRESTKVTVDSEMSHHEDTTSFEVKFRKDVRSLLAAMDDSGNPFKEVNENLVHIASKIVFDDAAAISVRSAYKNGEEQYYKFAQDRLCSENASLYDIVRKNKPPLFKHKKLSVISKSKQKITTLSADRRLFSHLYTACQSRKGDLENFFAHENQSFPVSISEYGKLRKCAAKSDFLKCLDEVVDPSDESPEVEMKVIDQNAPSAFFKIDWRVL